jgi:hypothetical protein
MNHEDGTREDLFADPEEVVTFAQAYYATEFPNDGRRDCPPPESLRAAAHSGELPGVELRAHLFNCSECFRAYRGARMNRRPQAAAGRPWWRGLGGWAEGLVSRPVPVAAVFACLVLSAAAVVMLWRARKDPAPFAANHSPQGPTRQAAPPPTHEVPAATAAPQPPAQEPEHARAAQSAQARRPKVGGRKQAAGLRVVEINLEEDSLLRGGGRSGQRVINVSPERQRIRLRLPRGSAAGRYKVSIMDAFGKPLVTTAANSDGKTLTVTLDLSSLSAKKYRLCLARDGEAPDCYLMSADAKKGISLK